MRLGQIIPRLLIQRTFKRNLQIIDDRIQRRAHLVCTIRQQQSGELAILQRRFLLPPHLDELPIHKTQYSGSFDLLLGPLATLAHHRFAPRLE